MNMIIKWTVADEIKSVTIDTLADYDWTSDYSCDDRDREGWHGETPWISREAEIDGHSVTVKMLAGDEVRLVIDGEDVTDNHMISDEDDVDHTLVELVDALDFECMYKEVAALDDSDSGYGYGVQGKTKNHMTEAEAHDYALVHGGGKVIREHVLTHELEEIETVEAAKPLASYKTADDDEATSYDWAVAVIKSGEHYVNVGDHVSWYKHMQYFSDLEEALEFRRWKRDYLHDDGCAELVVVRDETIVDWIY